MHAFKVWIGSRIDLVATPFKSYITGVVVAIVSKCFNYSGCSGCLQYVSSFKMMSLDSSCCLNFLKGWLWALE